MKRNIFYPANNVISFSDNHLGTLPIYALFRLLSFDRETSFQLWFIILFVLNYISAVWVLNKFDVNVLGIICGAYIFTFSLPIIAQAGHAQLLPRFMVPISIFLLYEFFNTKNNKSLLLLGITIVFQFYCTIYIGYFLLISLVSVAMSYCIINRNNFSIRDVLPQTKKDYIIKIFIILLLISLIIPLMLPYYEVSLESGYRSWKTISRMVPRLSSYLNVDVSSLVWGWLSDIGNTLPISPEHKLFPGLLPIVIIFLFIYLNNKNMNYFLSSKLVEIRTLLLAYTILFLTVLSYYSLSTGHVISPYFLLVKSIPGLSSIRAVTRIVLVTTMILSIIIGLIITLISNKLDEDNIFLKICITSILITCLVIDQYTTKLPNYPKIKLQEEYSELEKRINKSYRNIKAFAYMPNVSSLPPYQVHLTAMAVSQTLSIPTINGFSGLEPKNWDDFYFNEKTTRCCALTKWLNYASIKYNKPNLINEVTTIGDEESKQCLKILRHNE